MKCKIFLICLSLFCTQFVRAESNLTTQEILKRIFETTKANDRIAGTYGYWQENTIMKLNDDGSVKKQEKRTYRTVWIDEKPFDELMQVDGKALTEKQRKAEEERRKKFIKEIHQKNKDEDGDLTWDDLYQKYEFTPLPAEDKAVYVFAFHPKPGKQKERSREEKVFNHLSGKIRADENFNLVSAEAHLNDTITFGLGIIARIDKLQLEYAQQQFHDVFLPASFHVDFKAKIALLRTERQEIASRFYDPYARQEKQQHGSAP